MKKILFAAFILWVGLMGIAPHIYFSAITGTLSFFQYAFDEPYYYFLSIDPSGMYWTKRSNILLLFSKLFGNNPAPCMLLMDFICPAVLAGLSLFIASQFFKKASAVILCAVFILFGQELLSIGCMSIYGGAFNNFYYSLSDSMKQFIPYYGSTFYSIYRSPEPQVSYIPFLFLVGHLCYVFSFKEGKLSKWDWVINIAGNALVGWGYIFCAIPLGIFEAVICASFLLRKRYLEFTYLAAGGIALVGVVAYMSFGAGKDLTGSYAGFVFNSHLPSFGTSMIWAVLLFAASILLYRKKLMNADAFSLCIAGITIPFILMDQQIITGLTISARDWEKYSTYPFLVIAGALCFKALSGSLRNVSAAINKFFEISGVKLLKKVSVAGIAAICLILLLSNGQCNTYKLWKWYNNTSRSYVEAIRQFHPEQENVQLCPEHLMMEPLINISLGHKKPFILYFDDISTHIIKKMPENATTLPEGGEYYRVHAYEYFARRGISPSELDGILQSEIKNYAGFFLGFFFAPIDYTFVATDCRFYRKTEISGLIPLIIQGYTEYIADIPNSDFKETIILTTEAAADKPDRYFPSELIASTPLGIKVYRQKKISRDKNIQ